MDETLQKQKAQDFSNRMFPPVASAATTHFLGMLERELKKKESEVNSPTLEELWAALRHKNEVLSQVANAFSKALTEFYLDPAKDCPKSHEMVTACRAEAKLEPVSIKSDEEKIKELQEFNLRITQNAHMLIRQHTAFVVGGFTQDMFPELYPNAGPTAPASSDQPSDPEPIVIGIHGVESEANVMGIVSRHE